MIRLKTKERRIWYDKNTKRKGESSMAKRLAIIDRERCVACGACAKVCPKQALSVPNGICAAVETKLCVGCGRCAKTCPAGAIEVREVAAV